MCGRMFFTNMIVIVLNVVLQSGAWMMGLEIRKQAVIKSHTLQSCVCIRYLWCVITGAVHVSL